MSASSDRDLFAVLIDQCRDAGYVLIPHDYPPVIGHALTRTRGTITDFVTLPNDGYATVVRLHGGVDLDRPRVAPTLLWRHRLPLDMALEWLLTEPSDDHSLHDWQRGNYYRKPANDGDDEPFTTFAQYLRGHGKPQ